MTRPVITRQLAPDARPEKKRNAVRRSIVAAGSVALFLVPVNFAVVPRPLTLMFFGAVAVAACVGLVYAVPRHPKVCILIGLVLVCIVILHGFSLPLAYVPASLSAGYAIGSGKAWRWTVTGLWIAVTMSLSVEALLQAHLYLDLFPAQRFSTTVGGQFRARGVIGQAVPAAMLVVLLTTMMLVLNRSLVRRLLILAVGVAALLATGTRSSLIVVAVLLVLFALRLICVRSSRSRQSGLITMSVFAAVGAAFLSSGELARTRLLDFDGLAGTDSFVVRAEGLKVIRELDSACGAICTVFGNGPLALQARLNQGAAVRGLSTLDNYYLDAWWDGRDPAAGRIVRAGSEADADDRGRNRSLRSSRPHRLLGGRALLQRLLLDRTHDRTGADYRTRPCPEKIDNRENR